MKRKAMITAAVAAAGLAVGTLAPLPILAEDQEQAGQSQQGQSVQEQSVTLRDAQKEEQSDPQNQQQSQQDSRQENERSTKRPNADQQAVYGVLSKATEALVSARGGEKPLSQLMELVSQADRQRLEGSEQRQAQEGDNAGDQARGSDSAEFNQKVQQFRQDWQAKYGGEFDVKDEQVVFSGVRIHSGAPVRSGDTATASGERDNETAQQAGARISSGDSNRSGSLNAERSADQPDRGQAQQSESEAVTESGEVQVGRDAKKGEIPSDANSSDTETSEAQASDVRANSDTGRPARGEQAAARATASGKMITVMIPPHHNAAEAHLRLKREGNDWKIDLPDSMTREQLTANLSRHLGDIQQQKENWPEQESDAYKMVSHQLLVALTDSALKPTSPDAGQQEAR
jgi:hypothetical protein